MKEYTEITKTKGKHMDGKTIKKIKVNDDLIWRKGNQDRKDHEKKA